MHLMLLGMGEFLGEDGNRQGVTEVSPQAGQGSPLPPLPGLASTSPILPVALTHCRAPVHPRIPALSFGAGGTAFILARSYSLLCLALGVFKL